MLKKRYDNLSDGKDVVWWNPNTASEVKTNTGENATLSPATLMEHEFDHSVSKQTDPDGEKKKVETNDPNYTNRKEERVIKDSEAATGQSDGELKKGQHRAGQKKL